MVKTVEYHCFQHGKVQVQFEKGFVFPKPSKFSKCPLCATQEHKPWPKSVTKEV